MSTSASSAHAILIVEDESVVSMDLERSLYRLGYTVSGTVVSGEEALESVRSNKPELVLMDIQLHGNMDGLTTAEAIHREFDLPIVFVTANVDAEAVARARQSGSYGFLNKPFRVSELNATIEIALHRHRAAQSLVADRERLGEEVQLTSEALGHTRKELQALSHHLMKVQEDERGRIARELHDDLGQQASLLCMQVDMFGIDLPAHKMEEMALLRSGLDALAQGLRDVSHKLHPAIVADLGITEALDGLVSEFRSQGLAIEASLASAEQVPLDVATSLYRIAQESLLNVLKHAARSTAQVSLTVTRAQIELRISDNGQGFGLDDVRRRGGLGLISMQERARLAGGVLLLSTEPGKGTTVLVRVPFTS